MIIGIDASRAFIEKRTGIEEYSYQVIKHLRAEIKNQQVVLYIRPDQAIDFDLPENWKIKKLWAPRFWTQLGLSLEMLLHPVEVLFIPAHTVPIIHPLNTIVTVHGLEYEFCPAAYSPWEKFYMRCSIRNSCRWASVIIAVSENTKKDLVDLYKVPDEKIEVIYEGYERSFQFPISNFQSNSNGQNSDDQADTKYKILNTRYILFIGRLEERKNIIGIIKAFEILKEHYGIPHQLVLAGRFGYGQEKIREELKNTNCGQNIVLLGYVSEEEKWELLKNAEVFLFPTFYEGFGIPVLEAQSMGVPVVAGDNSSIPEIVKIPLSPPLGKGENGPLPLKKGEMERDFYSALLVDPLNAEEIADAVHKLISDESLKNAIIKQGYENVKRFSWDKCAREIARLLIEANVKK